jgi:hypothetical protein
MGSTVITDTDFRAFVEPSGDLLIFSFEQSYEKNTWPRTPRWGMIGADRIDGMMQRIGQNCAHIEDGIVQLADGMNQTEQSDALYFAERQLAALRDPIQLIHLPETTTIVDPNFDNWRWRGFESRDEMRSRFDELLKAYSIRSERDRTVHVERSIDLLLRLDGLGQGCHDAWPKKRMPSNHGLAALGKPDKGTPIYERMEAFNIAEAPNLFLVQHLDAIDPHNDDPDIELDRIPTLPIIMDSLGALKNYWKNYFPLSALHESWPDDLAELTQSLRSDPTPANTSGITLHRPRDPKSIPMELWRECAGDGLDEIRLPQVLQHFADAPWKAEQLAKACDVSIGSPDPSEDDGCGYDEYEDDGYSFR